MTYNDKLLKLLLKENVIDQLILNCNQPGGDQAVKLQSTQALVHFALNEKSIDILIKKGVMDLFNQFNDDKNFHKDFEAKQEFQMIQLNTAWIFLALCCSGITGEQMLKSGITLNMFLISCNSNQFENEDIRSLVITAFSELGKFNESIVDAVLEHNEISQRASFQLHEEFQIEENSQQIIEVLLYFAASKDSNYQHSSYKCLKDYLFQNHEKLEQNSELLEKITQAFISGCMIDENLTIQKICTNSISFLITQNLVYKESILEQMDENSRNKTLQQQPSSQVLDAIMFMSGSKDNSIRGTAFSTLSSLSTYCSNNKTAMYQIKRDTKLPEDDRFKNSESNKGEYYKFIKSRLEKVSSEFKSQYQQTNIEKQFSGLHSLLSLAQDPNDQGFMQSIDDFLDFIEVLKENKEILQQEHDKSVRTNNQQKSSKSPQNNPKNKQFKQVFDQFHHIEIQIVSDIENQKDLEFLMRNELYFVKVFHSIMKCESPLMIEKMLKVICYYIGNTFSKYVDEMITPEIVIWLLKMQKFCTHHEQQFLGTKCAMVMLEIVQKHEIIIHYQEVEIINLFRCVLEQFNLLNGPQNFPGNKEDQNILKKVDEEDELSNGKTDSQLNDSLSFYKKEADQQSDNSLDIREEGKCQEQNLFVQCYGSEDQSSSAKILYSEEQEESVDQESEITIHKELEMQNPTQFKQDQHLSDKDGSQESKDNPSKTNWLFKVMDKLQQQKANDCEKDNLVLKLQQLIKIKMTNHIKNKMNQNILRIYNKKQDLSPQVNVKNPNRLKFKISKRKFTSSRSVHLMKNQFANIHSEIDLIEKAHSECSSELVASKDNRSIITKLEDLEEDHHQDDIERVYMDHIIKCFMVIFTNDHSKHLLLNQDLIEIALSCLENSDSITIEAQDNVSKLLSKVLQYPQIQMQIIQNGDDYFKGINYLLRLLENKDDKIKAFLSQSDDGGESSLVYQAEKQKIQQQTQIVKYMIESTLYISMNQKFITNQIYCKEVLQPVLAIVSNQNKLKLFEKSYLLKMILIISNVLKGTFETKQCFQKCNGISLLFKIIDKYREKDSESESLTCSEDSSFHNSELQINQSEDFEMDLIDQCLEGVTEHVSSKRIIFEVIQNQLQLTQLFDIIQATLRVSEFWPIEISYHDPFNTNNPLQHKRIFGKRQTMSRKNPIFQTNNQIQDLFKSMDSQKRSSSIYNNIRGLGSSNRSFVSSSNPITKIQKEDNLILERVNNALQNHQQKYLLHMRLTKIRSNSYLLLSRVIKYKEIESDSFLIKLIQDLEHLSNLMDDKGRGGDFEFKEEKQCYAEQFVVDLQTQFYSIFNNIIKAINSMQKNQKLKHKLLSIGKDSKTEYRTKFLQVIKKIKNEELKIKLMTVFCNLIVEFVGPENETFLEYAATYDCSFKITMLIKILFEIQNNETTLEQSLIIISLLIDQKEMTVKEEPQWIILKSVLQLRQMENNDEMLATCLNTLRQSQNVSLIEMCFKIIQNIIKEINLIKESAKKLKIVNVSDIIDQVIDTIQNLDAQWLSAFNGPQKLIFQRSTCQILHQINNIQTFEEGNNNIEQIDNQIISNLMCCEYQIKVDSAADHESFISDDYEIDSQYSDDPTSPTRMTKIQIHETVFQQDENTQNQIIDINNQESSQEQAEKYFKLLEEIVEMVTCEKLDLDMIQQLIQDGLIDVCAKFVSIYNSHRLSQIEDEEFKDSVQEDNQNLDILTLNINSIELIQNVSKILFNISKIAHQATSLDQLGHAVQILHMLSVSSITENPSGGLIQILQQMCFLAEYELQVNLSHTIGNFLLPFHSVKVERQIQVLKFEVQTKMIQNKFLIRLQNNVQNPFCGWLKISRICHQMIEQMGEKEEYLFRLNNDFIQFSEKQRLQEEMVPGQ